ncbi:MAG TPA: FAD/NAD(P)-binding oxidoreductase [Acidobacteriaceae bacterium]|jgi:NADPH-dependent 2,4-dienoyl-CoA reductase/sulfur reductase-like enzyme|nr:FAD/NAD(P)-binding oxidoreductase [Acidobacteriaceae bacterium]
MKQHFDVLVVGAGPAGVVAAVTAAQCGQRAALVDDNPAAGGQIWRSGAPLPKAARAWLARLESSRVVRLQGWRVFDAPGRTVLLAERNGASAAGLGDGTEIAELHAAKVILATGARERFLPFPGWTLPHVTGVGGLDALTRGGLPMAGKRVVVAGTGPLLLAVAGHLAGNGARIVAVCEQAPLERLVRLGMHVLREPGKLWQGMQYRRAMRTRLLTRCWVTAAHGEDRVRSVTLRQGKKHWEVGCDALACGFHLVPNTELAELLGCRVEEGLVATDEQMRTSVEDVYCAGEPTGIGGVELSRLEGQIAALAACGRGEEARGMAARRRGKLGFVRALAAACQLDPELKKLTTDETIVCRCEDVRFRALRGRLNWREAKLQTRCGMGPCQGRVCGAATEFLFGWGADSVRPPVFPAAVASLAAAGQANNFTATMTTSEETEENV